MKLLNFNCYLQNRLSRSCLFSTLKSQDRAFSITNFPYSSPFLAFHWKKTNEKSSERIQKVAIVQSGYHWHDYAEQDELETKKKHLKSDDQSVVKN